MTGVVVKYQTNSASTPLPSKDMTIGNTNTGIESITRPLFLCAGRSNYRPGKQERRNLHLCLNNSRSSKPVDFYAICED